MAQMMADTPAAHSSFMVRARAISVPDEAAAWERLGFTIDDGLVQIGGVRIRPGAARFEVAADGLDAEQPDGLALVHAREDAAGPAPAHPNGAVVLDHVAALTDDLERTLAALETARLELRRVRGRMAFLRLGELILELVETDRADVGFWGLVVVVPDLGRLGPLVGDPKDAVQPGRRIATVRREAGLTTALAFMTPRGLSKKIRPIGSHPPGRGPSRAPHESEAGTGGTCE
jgi:hypothetical protein